MGSGYAPSEKIELRAIPVQELAQTYGCDDQLRLQRYIHNNDNIDLTNLPLITCPTIDFQLLKSSSSSSSPDQQEVLEELRLALTTWGCFQIVNHGMSTSFLDEMRQVIKGFFSLPLEEKRRYERPIDDFEGYGNDTFLLKDQVLDWTDRLYILVYPVDKRRIQFWPHNPQSLRETMHRYALNSQEIVIQLLKAMARSVALEETSFLKQHGGEEEGIMFARLNLYPKCPLPERVLGIKAHSDGPILTILLQDKQVEGLQVLKGDQWFRVPVHPSALFVNVGDQLEIMSNGIFKSPIHRVVTSAAEERISLVLFCSANRHSEIWPVDELITEDRPQQYKRLNNYAEIFFKHYQLGERAIPAVRI